MPAGNRVSSGRDPDGHFEGLNDEKRASDRPAEHPTGRSRYYPGDRRCSVASVRKIQETKKNQTNLAQFFLESPYEVRSSI
jgi:hypothetical protein